MTEFPMVYCQGRRIGMFRKEGWWHCGCCGRRIRAVGKTYEVDRVSA